MKYIVILILMPLLAYSQNNLSSANPNNIKEAEKKNSYILPIATMSIKGSHPIGINNSKTVHIIFPNEIKEVDAGIPEILTVITPSFSNVLKIKAANEQSFTESNLTVLTSSGDLYSFIVNYSEFPEILNIDVKKNFTSDVTHANNFKTDTFDNSDFLIPKLDMSESTMRTNFQHILSQKPKIKNIGVQNLNISCFAQNLYMDNTLLYIRLKIDNSTANQYPLDFIKVYVSDVETAKREAVQQSELAVVLLDKINAVEPNSNADFVIAVPRITLSNEKQLEIEIYEKNGGRHLRFPVNSKIVSNAKLLSLK